MINPCARCIEQDRCKEMKQPCDRAKAYKNWKAGCKRVAQHIEQINKRMRNRVVDE